MRNEFMLKINDITTCEQLESEQMLNVKGGLDPFAHLGLTSMLYSIPGYSPPDDYTAPEDEVGMYSPGETIYVEDINHTEITTSYPA